MMTNQEKGKPYDQEKNQCESVFLKSGLGLRESLDFEIEYLNI